MARPVPEEEEGDRDGIESSCFRRRRNFIDCPQCCWEIIRRCFSFSVPEMIKIYFSTFCCMFSNAYANTMLFPFLPFMVQFLLPQIDKASVGKYTGIIAGSMSFGKVCTNLLWGALSDGIGRKPVMLTNLVIVGLSSFLFGFSVNFPMAVAMILIQGLGNSILSTTNTILAESSTDKNRALGMTLLSTGWGSGMIIGPAVSGVLADPVGQYNLSLNNESIIRIVLSRYPYSLPCAAHSLICFLSILTVVFCLPETRKMRNNKMKKEADELELLTVGSRNASYDSVSHENDHKEKHRVKIWLTRKWAAMRNLVFTIATNLRMFASDMNIWLVVINFCIMACATVMFDEIYPLWAATPVQLGGIQFKVYEIGLSLTMVGVALLPLNLLLYPLMEVKFGSINAFHISAVQVIVAIVLMPNIHYLTQMNGSSGLLWCLLIVSLIIVLGHVNVCAAACFLFVNNSVTFDKLGTLSGLTTSLGFIFRVIGPTLIGVLFSASLSDTAMKIGFPLNYHLTFIIVALCWLAMMPLVAMLPSSINKQKHTGIS